MSAVLEIEITYLAATLPDLSNCKHAEMRDIYFPVEAEHSVLRIRQKDEHYELTKKTQLDPHDFGTQQEDNVNLSKAEFDALAKAPGKVVVKTRYYYPCQGAVAEIDVFKGDLQGLVLVDVEFASQEARNTFKQPDFCLADATQDEFIAGGMLAGKTYEDIRIHLEAYNYKPL